MKKKILVIANGTIGDIVTAMPAMQKICTYHKDDIVHLYNTRIVANDIHKTLFDHLDWFDRMDFRVVSDSLYRSIFQRFSNWWNIFSEHYDIIYELPGNFLMPKKMLKAFGAKKICSPEVLEPRGVPRFRYLLQQLEQCGIPRFAEDENIDWNFQPEEISAAEEWLSRIRIPVGFTPFIVCTGGKSPVQHWHLGRYAEVLKKIVPEYHLFPVFVGAGGEKKDAEYLITECGAGVFSQDIGPLSLREMILVFRNFKFYFGNDTGILHLAGAAGIPCMGISSARAFENFWTPLGRDHHIMTADVPCKGCRRNQCLQKSQVLCLDKIQSAEVLSEAAMILKHIN